MVIVQQDVDFGYCKTLESIPTNFIDLQKIDKNRVHYTLVNSIDPRIDGHVIYTFQHAPEKLAGVNMHSWRIASCTTPCTTTCSSRT